MRKKIISIAITIVFVLSSFFYTNEIINYFKDNDPIMIELKKYNESFNKNIINSNYKIDIESSYKNMKKVGEFDDTLLVFKNNDDYNISFDKYIVSLDKLNNKISLLFDISDYELISNVLNILNTKNVNSTFFVPKELFDTSIETIKSIYQYGNDIELLSNNYSVYEVNKYNSILRLATNDKLDFCINLNKNNTLLNSCVTSKLYSIIPTVIDLNIYNKVKKELRNGAIILLKINKQNIKELLPTINYIKQKGKEIILLKKELLQ